MLRLLKLMLEHTYKTIVRPMGVNHGGTSPPRIWSAGDASANRPPPEFVRFQNLKHQLLTYNAV